MVVLPFFSELDWEAYIVSIAKIATKKLGSLICSMFLSSRLVFFSINLLSGFKSGMRFPKSNKKKKEIRIFLWKQQVGKKWRIQSKGGECLIFLMTWEQVWHAMGKGVKIPLFIWSLRFWHCYVSYCFKGCVRYILASFVSSLNESTCETKKNVFNFTSKAPFVLEKIKFYNSTFSNFITSPNASA